MILHNSKELQEYVLRMMRTQLMDKSGGFLLIASPWVSDFTFEEGVISMDSELIKIFPEEITLLELIQMVSRSVAHSKKKPLFIVHDFSINIVEKPLNLLLDEVLTQLDESDNWFLYKELSNYFYQKTNFNRIWLNRGIVGKIFENRNYKGKDITKAISEIGSKMDQIEKNKEYLDMLRNLINAGSVVLLNKKFHLKIFMTDNAVLAGSSNWTYSGFNRNDELNIYISKQSDELEFKVLRRYLDDLIKESEEIDLEKIDYFITICNYFLELYQKLVKDLSILT